MTLRWLSPRTQSIALVVSLAVNLLVASAVGAYAIHRHHDWNRDRNAARIERLADRLPDADAAKLRAAYTAREAEFKAAREETRRLRDAVRAALRAQPFDAKALDDAVARLATQTAATRKAFYGMVAATAAQMSADGRTRLAEPHHRR